MAREPVTGDATATPGLRLAILAAGPLLLAGGRTLSPRSPWLSAALALLGIGAIVWTAAEANAAQRQDLPVVDPST